MAPKTSSIWEFFETHPTKSEMVICKTCQKGRSPTSAKNHLKSMHKVQYLSFLELENEQKAKKELKATEPKRNLPEVTAARKDNLKDITIEQSFRRKEQRLWDNKDPKSQRFDRLIAEMIAVDDLPLSFVGNIGFSRFCRAALPNYELKRRTCYSEHVDKLYDEVSQKVKNILADYEKISFTTDIWTVTHAAVSLLSLTGHILSENFERKKVVLCAQELHSAHTAQNINNEFHDMLAKWDIADNRVHVVIRDAGANMVTALREDYTSRDCGAHQNHLVVVKHLKEQRAVNDCLERCRAVASHFHHSNKAQLELKDIQERLITVATDVASESAEHVNTTRSIIMPITDCATRWNTSYDMFSRHMELEDALRQYKRFNVNTADFEVIKKLVKILKPFKTFTEKISRSDATLGDLLVCSKALCMTLNERYADDDKDVG